MLFNVCFYAYKTMAMLSPSTISLPSPSEASRRLHELLVRPQEFTSISNPYVSLLTCYMLKHINKVFNKDFKFVRHPDCKNQTALHDGAIAILIGHKHVGSLAR